jgi:hypothetical protein
MLWKETYRMTRTGRFSQMLEDIKKKWPYELTLMPGHEADDANIMVL